MPRNMELFCLRNVVAVLILVLTWPGLLAARQLELFDIYKGNLGVAIDGVGALRGTGQVDPVTGESLTVATVPVNVPRVGVGEDEVVMDLADVRRIDQK